MSTHSERLWTLEETAAHNVKRLRREKKWSETELANQLTATLERPYTRSMVSDIEGRRERAVRWVELAALCAIFDVALWNLVLPPEGVRIDSRIAFGSVTDVDVTDSPPYDPEQVTTGRIKGTIWHDYPDRDDLAFRIFNLDSQNLASGKLQDYAKRREVEREDESVRAIAEVMLPLMQAEFARREEESD